MATVKIYFDTRKARKDNSYPIKLRVQNRTAFLVSTNLYALENEFVNNAYAKNANNYKIKNIALRNKINRTERYLLELEDSHKINSLTDKELKSKIEALISTDVPDERYFCDVMEEYANKCKRKNTTLTYLQTLDKIKYIDPTASFSTINTDWLYNFSNELADSGLSVNSISIHLRNIRTVFNYAIDNDETELYPFKKFKIESQETAHRALSIEQLQLLKHANIEDYQIEYRDIFFLMMYLIGINSIDLLSNETTKIVGNRIEYYRKKTGRFYSIKLEPEALNILKRYRGKNELLNVTSSSEYRTYVAAMNRGLKKMSYELPDRVGLGGRKVRNEICSSLSAYWARHTWATIASHLDIPIDTISEALGHNYGSSVTARYIKFDRKKIDYANRKVIDFINLL